MIQTKTAGEIERMRASGRILAEAIRRCGESIVPGRTTPQDLNDLAEGIMRAAGATPGTLGYRGYPAASCISVNDVVIHGIPDRTPLEEGDIVDVDLVVEKDGWYADGAWTFPVGKVSKEVERLLAVTKEALAQGIAKARVGNRVGDVSATIQRYCERNGYGVVREMLGHGIGRAMHEEPDVPNYGKPGTGERLREGMVLCIEPMINQGTAKIVTLEDGWTVKTLDGKPSAHFEHTVLITKNGPDILTRE